MSSNCDNGARSAKTPMEILLLIQNSSKIIKEKDRQIRAIQVDIDKKEKALAEATASEVLRKKSHGDLGGPRGRMISTADRRYALELIDEANTPGGHLPTACRVLGITERTYHRWKKILSETGKLDDLRPCAERPTPANKLSPEEEQTILEQVNSPEFVNSSSTQIIS